MEIKNFDIEKNTLRIEASSRGGGIEIDVSNLFGEDCKISAYQNYLGGGLLGAVQSDINFMPSKEQKANVLELSEKLKRYFHEITRHDYDDWEDMEYEQNQNMEKSAY